MPLSWLNWHAVYPWNIKKAALIPKHCCSKKKQLETLLADMLALTESERQLINVCPKPDQYHIIIAYTLTQFKPVPKRIKMAEINQSPIDRSLIKGHPTPGLILVPCRCAFFFGAFGVRFILSCVAHLFSQSDYAHAVDILNYCAEGLNRF